MQFLLPNTKDQLVISKFGKLQSTVRALFRGDRRDRFNSQIVLEISRPYRYLCRDGRRGVGMGYLDNPNSVRAVE